MTASSDEDAIVQRPLHHHADRRARWKLSRSVIQSPLTCSGTKVGNPFEETRAARRRTARPASGRTSEEGQGRSSGGRDTPRTWSKM
jgi:hypothetical protein